MIADKMRQRRRQLQESLQNENASDIEDLSGSSQTPMIINSQSNDVESEPENILEGMKSRRVQRLAEISDASKEAGSASQTASRGVFPGSGRTSASSGGPLNMSIRERLRNRVKSQSTESNLPGRKLRGLRERNIPSRFEESYAFDSNQTLDPYLQESIANAKQWKKMKMQNKEEFGLVSSEDAFKFFLGEVDTDDNGLIMKQISRDGSVVAIDIEDTPLIYNAKPTNLTNKERLKMEDEIYSYPSILPALLEDKIAEGCQPRDLESEGFYVGLTPTVPIAVLNRMENRIIASHKEDKSWFTEDGTLHRASNPLRDHLTRQILVDDYVIDPSLHLQWAKAQRTMINTQYIDERGAHHYQLDVDISMINFTHHPLFSLEHVLEAKLIQLYNQYVRREKCGTGEHIANKLEALRRSLQQMEMESPRHERSTLMKNEHEKRIRSIQLEMSNLYVMKRNSDTQDRQLLMNILQTWQTMKKLRESQGFVNTPTLLKVKKETTNRKEDEKRIEVEISEQITADRVVHDEKHKERNEFYKEQLEKWKEYQRLKKKLKADPLQSSEGLEEVLKPDRPPAFDEIQAREWIKLHLSKHQRRPGEPILIPILQNGAVITNSKECPRAEQLRRSAMKDSKYMVKVVFNDMDVSQTAIRSLSSDFLVQFGEILSIKILQWPESVKLQLLEMPAMSKLAEVYAIIPDGAMTKDTMSLDLLEFASDQVVEYKHEAVGSGIPIYLNETDPNYVIPLTSGVLYAGVYWGEDAEGHSLAPPISTDTMVLARNVRRTDALASLGATGMVDLQKLLSWISNAQLDPNNPNNADVLNLAKMAHVQDLENISGPQFFRLNQLEKELEFVSQEEMESNRRFKLIKLRDAGVPELKHHQMIPPYEQLISDDVFEEYEKRLNEVTADGDDEDYTQRKAVIKFLAKVREQVHARSQMAKRQLDLDDMVLEEAVPDIGSLGARIFGIMEPRRPLRPVRKERKKVGGQNLEALKEVHILLNIVRAFDIPVRLDPNTPLLPTGQDGYNQPASELRSLVRPFIEVMFQGTFLKTCVADGAWPNWNEDLIIPFKPSNNDFSTDALQLVKDKIFINLFDEVIIDLLKDNRQRETNVHHRVEKRWLGSLEIPFSTLYFTSKVEGFFQLNTPTVLLGYKRSHGSRIGRPSPVKTSLQLYMTIEPQLQPAPVMPEKFETSESAMLVHNSQVWLTELRSKQPRRTYKTMATDIDGKKVFLSRFVRPQNPPTTLQLEEGVPLTQKMKLLSRFVSLIPYVADSVQFPDLCDIWTTSDQFLRMLCGDEEEHAVLLCNYFLWLNVNSYLVLGKGVPEGATAYVLCEIEGSYRLWNASTGANYSVENNHCPLLSVGMVINQSNIYANIQSDEHPSKIVYSFNNTKMWRPFFSKSYPNPGLGSIQAETLCYLPVNDTYALSLKDKIERKIKDKLMEWRPRHITKFNRFCTQAFKSILTSMESRLVLSNYDEQNEELDRVLQSHELTGFPLHMPFTDMETIVDRIYSTGVHNCEDDDVEFALAAHLHPYPSGVLAVWVYIGRLTRK